MLNLVRGPHDAKGQVQTGKCRAAGRRLQVVN